MFRRLRPARSVLRVAVATFGLVHGAYHGSWCWDQLRAALENRGHRVLTVDLPTENPHAGANEYTNAAIEGFADADDGLVVVGHSLAGLTIPLIATRRPVSRLVYLCAMLPRPGRTQEDVIAAESDMFGPPLTESAAFTDDRGATRWYPDAAAGAFFSDCPPELAAWAAAKLRGQFWRITQEVTPLQSHPAVPTAAVIGLQDLVMNPAWSRRVIPAVLGITPIELPCGHAPSVHARVARRYTDNARLITPTSLHRARFGRDPFAVFPDS
jgi:Alpha/beta hydrolase family